MRYLVIALLFAACLMVVTGCAQVSVETVEIPANLSISKIEIGMSKNQVRSIMEPSTDYEHFTLDVLIPMHPYTYYQYSTYYYKNQGRITFSGDNRVVDFEYDPNEDGWK